MLSYEEALRQLLSAAEPVGKVERIASHLAVGRVLAETAISPIAVPPADNSAMDGYAIRTTEVARTPLPVSQRIPAGASPSFLQAGTAARIFTGAPIPFGADAVVMQEKVQLHDSGIVIEQSPQRGENIRRAGEDISAGSPVVSAGVRLSPAALGLLASVGIAEVKVYSRLRVAVFFTGNELVTPGEQLRPGTIYNSNRHVLYGLLGELGCEVSDFGVVPDSFEATRDALRRASVGHDLVLTCGGVSVGEEDHVKEAVLAEGALDTWKIAIKPGKPFAFGRVCETPFIGLPGNPVSSFVTFLMLAKPYICKRQGITDCTPKSFRVTANFSWPRAAQVREFLRVRANDVGTLDLFAKQGSGVLTSCAWATGLVDNPPGQVIQPGDMVRYIPFA
ncbi:MAG: molybdopterin molybdotransferase MoeA [Uliginosibacterium sp.]|nr:molybdopterin molybdotransferase MoeA [Uliginosibacterium sp.]